MTAEPDDAASPFRPSVIGWVTLAIFAVVFVLFSLTDLDPEAGPLYDVLLYVSVLWHLVAFFLVQAVPAPGWARTAGSFWALSDGLVDVLYINGVDPDLAWNLRLGTHIALALWLVGSSLVGGIARKVVGIATAVLLAAYSWAAPHLPDEALMPVMIGLFVWLVLTALHLRSEPAR